MKIKQCAAWVMIGCLLLAGCQSTGSAQLSPVSPVTLPDVPEQLLTNENPVLDGHATANGQLAFTAGGRQRIAYNGLVGNVQYITDVSQLPDYEAFKQYDEAFFKEHALVLVTQSTGSGSIQMEIDTIVVEAGVAKITLKQNMPGDVGTADMATWLVWVEVEAGLDLQWQLGTMGNSSGNNMEMHTH